MSNSNNGKRRPRRRPAAPPPAVTNSEPTTLDLDSLEREGAPSSPFRFTVGGRTYAPADPFEVDWQDLVSAYANPVTFFRTVLAADDAEEFLRTPLPSWKINQLIESYQKHYGMPTQGELSALSR